jgi:hypothetical protein
MSTTPPPEQPGAPGPGGLRPGYTAMGNFSMARMPTPGNAEFLYVVLALILVAIIALFAETIGVATWMEYFRWISVAYIISRGLAKASRVLEE